ncbi:MAG: DUF1007 family protein [Campylobacterota bacterium]|nr:DUF1007 family protein [Campylobacterota bacterium]
MKTIFILFVFISSLCSHPHTFIEVHPTLKVKESSAFVVNFKWVLDDMSSTILVMELDQNGDGKIDKRENRYAYEEYFSIFENYHYYTYIKVDGKDVKLPKVENFQTTIENNKLCYSFEMKLNYDIEKTAFEFGDSDFYVAMVLKSEFVNAGTLPVKVTGVDNDFYYGYRLEFR